MTPKTRLTELEKKRKPKANLIIRVDWSTEDRDPEPGEKFVTWEEIGEDDETQKTT
jgi:hypothetical protein